eukprot:1156524-Pelagomonas_calceolata.AAC.8
MELNRVVTHAPLGATHLFSCCLGLAVTPEECGASGARPAPSSCCLRACYTPAAKVIPSRQSFQPGQEHETLSEKSDRGNNPKKRNVEIVFSNKF